MLIKLMCDMDAKKENCRKWKYVFLERAARFFCYSSDTSGGLSRIFVENFRNNLYYYRFLEYLKNHIQIL